MAHTPTCGGVVVTGPGPGTAFPAGVHAGDEPLWSHMHADAVIAQFELVNYDEMSLRCEPKVLLAILHQLHALLDRLTDKHSLYKVDSHAGWLSIAANVSDRVDRPTERILNCACEFIASARDVGLRVIGRQLAFRAAVNAGVVTSAVLGTSALRFGIYGPCEAVCRQLVARSRVNTVLAPETFVRLLAASSAPNVEPRPWEKLGALRVEGMKESLMSYLLDPTGQEVGATNEEEDAEEEAAGQNALRNDDDVSTRQGDRERYSNIAHDNLSRSNVNDAAAPGPRKPAPAVGFALVFPDQDTEKEFRRFQGVRMSSMDALHLVISLVLIQTVVVRTFAQNGTTQPEYASPTAFLLLMAALVATVAPLVIMIISQKWYLELRTCFMGAFRLVRVLCLVFQSYVVPGALLGPGPGAVNLFANALVMNSIVHALHAIGAQIVLRWHLVVQILALGAAGINNYRACSVEGVNWQEECLKRDVMGTLALQVLILLVIPTVFVWRVERLQRRTFARWFFEDNLSKGKLPKGKYEYEPSHWKSKMR